MSISKFDNLLGCRNLGDWMTVRNELPKLFTPDIEVSTQFSNSIIYHALQGVAPFQVCVVSYRYDQEYILLQGRQELKALMDFFFGKTVLREKQWTLPVPFPDVKNPFTTQKDGEFSYKDLCLPELERLRFLEIPHVDFIVEEEVDLKMLKDLYSMYGAHV